MTTPPQPPTPFDAGNPLLTAGPANLTTSQVVASNGAHLAAVTIRTSSATLTVFLARDDVREWARLLEVQASQMSGLIVAPAGVMPLQ